ncbi:CTP synthetase [Rickettsia akari str. Hartford]|uniref:CTP synthetase n=1 Tax=Rickettsia akari (strain Hartford) TaxID=293614 RepID=A8GN84_RICAH|nr:CTP synthetase [Rickettsia akari str. Hartford]
MGSTQEVSYSMSCAQAGMTYNKNYPVLKKNKLILNQWMPWILTSQFGIKPETVNLGM